jgi:MFS family permease
VSETGQPSPNRTSNLPSMTNPLDIGAVPRPALYHGWFVVAAAFLIAFFGFGFGFYGPGVYLVALSVRHGWPVAALVPAITAYYMLGAILLFFWVGPLFDRCGARRVVSGGVAAMTVGLVLLTEITQQWQVYAAFAIMAIGWATMSGAAINIIVAPWFDKRRGLAVSWSLNGANAGGILVVPLLTFVAARLGFAAALQAAAVVMVAVLIPVVVLVLRPKEAG